MSIVSKVLELLERKGSVGGYASLDDSSVVEQQPPAIDAAKITSGRFGMARMPDGTLGHVLRAKGDGVDPVYEAMTLTVTQAIAPAYARSDIGSAYTTIASASVPANAVKVIAWGNLQYLEDPPCYMRIVYNGVEKAAWSNSNVYNGAAGQWTGDGVGSAATLAIQVKSCGPETPPSRALGRSCGGWYVTI